MIRLENVTKRYGGETVAVRDVSFDVAKGDFVFLVGPSGSGKSTILRLINRQERPERGEVWVAGRNINDISDSRVPFLRRSMGNVFQDYKLLTNKTVFENVAFALEVIGKPRHVIASQVPLVLDLVGLAGKEDRFPHQLSGGEQQRVSIARSSCWPTNQRATSIPLRAKASWRCSTKSIAPARLLLWPRTTIALSMPCVDV